MPVVGRVFILQNPREPACMSLARSSTDYAPGFWAFRLDPYHSSGQAISSCWC